MKKRSLKGLVVAAASAGLVLGVVAPASAAETDWVHGGQWTHGFSGHNVISNYYNVDIYTWQHRSSVTTSYGYWNSGWKDPGWSYASLQQSLTGNKANWDVR